MPSGSLLTQLYAGKYAALSGAPSPEPYRRAVLGDDLFIIGLPMLLAAFVTLLVSHSLFPDERDFRILGPLPVRKAVVFGAKLAALLLFTGLFIAVAHVSLVPLMLLTSMNPFGEHAVAVAADRVGDRQCGRFGCSPCSPSRRSSVCSCWRSHAAGCTR